MNDREWFEKYWPQVYRMCRYMLKEASEAEDACQEVFVKALTADRTQIQDMKPWLMRIAINECNKRLRRKGIGRSKEMLHYVLSSPLPSQSTEEIVERKETAEAFAHLLSRLPAKLRLVIVLRFSEDMTLQDIAGTLNVPVGTVKSRLNRAISMLRKLVDQKGVLFLKEDEKPWSESIKVN